jgi:adenylate cyclase
MFTAPDLVTACAAAADLLEVASRTDLPPLRVGIAYGPMLRAYADFFGRTVNVASRLCDIAPAGGILAASPDKPVRDSRWKSAALMVREDGKKRLRGISGRVPVLRVKRLE